MTFKIGFLWHNVSSGNLGVGALSISNMLYAKDALDELGLDGEFFTIGDNEITDAGNKELVENQIGIKFNHIDFSVKDLLLHPSKMLKYHTVITSLDLVLDIGAGDSFSDIYGFKRFFIQVFTKIHAAKFASKFVLSPQTVGPFYSKKAEFVAKYILNKADYVFARDKQSFDVAMKIAHESNISLATDVALRMPFPRQCLDNINVGINISGLLWNGGYSGKNEFNIKHSYVEFVKESILYFLSIENVTVHLVSHVISTIPASVIEDDFLAATSLKNQFFREDERVVLAPRFTNPINAKSYISGFDFFTGARMHATIAAFSGGVPCLPYAYSRKFSGLYNTFGYYNVLDARDMTLEEALAQLKDSFERRDEIKKSIQQCFTEIKKLGDNYKESLKTIITRCE